jgi:glycerophosphoryl diester phosphodiesterase
VSICDLIGDTGDFMIIIGHRGARACAPENTLRALEIGMECADCVEVDVRRSRDGVAIIMHDATVDRTTNGTGMVGSLTREELKALDAGAGESIPTLREVVDFIAGRCGLVVEIKEPGTEELVCSELRRKSPDPLWIVSFHQECLKVVSTLFPAAKTGFIYSKAHKDPVFMAQSVNADAVLPKITRADQNLVDLAHRSGLSVFLWTLNTKDEFLWAYTLGTDGFASDDPCLARRYFSERED